MNRLSVLAASTFGLIVAQGTVAQGMSAEPKPRVGMPAADNSANNDTKRMSGQPTADQQSNRKEDIALTQRVRKSVMDDESLSVYGKNVKIISAGGNVTLNGVVKTADEKRRIGLKATEIAGDRHVVNELEVAPTN